MQATRKLSVFPGLSAKRRDNIERRGNNHDNLTALTSNLVKSLILIIKK